MMTDYEIMTLAITTCGVVLGLLSVTLLARQVALLRQQVRAHAIGQYWARWVEIDRFFHANPDIRPFFYEGKDLAPVWPESSVLEHRLGAAAEMLLDHFANMYFERHCVRTREEEQVHMNFMRNMYAQQPFFARFVDEHAHWYSEGLLRHLRAPPPRGRGLRNSPGGGSGPRR